MSKYIDADLLRKEIKRRIEILKKAELDWSKQGDTETSLYYSGKSVALDEFNEFIDSLQQEQDSVAERFARIVRGNLIGIDKEVQQKFEQLYFEITGNKMYGGYND